MPVKVFTAPEKWDKNWFTQSTIFLGGTIEQGTATNWQQTVIDSFNGTDVTILNPRRAKWNASLPQDPTPGTEFHTQVTWEIDAQNISDLIIYNFEADSKSPITLLELGLYATSGGVVVCCPKTYWRYGNVKIVCDLHGIPIFETLEELCEHVKSKFSIQLTEA